MDFLAVIVTIVFAALGIIWRTRSEIQAAKAELKADMTEMKAEMKADIKAIDERQRRMENDISFIKGALAVAIPGFKEGIESLVAEAEASEEERVSEPVGD